MSYILLHLTIILLNVLLVGSLLLHVSCLLLTVQHPK
jgi:hypothetical protein